MLFVLIIEEYIYWKISESNDIFIDISSFAIYDPSQMKYVIIDMKSNCQFIIVVKGRF
jgi:hypothetical protein